MQHELFNIKTVNIVRYEDKFNAVVKQRVMKVKRLTALTIRRTLCGCSFIGDQI